MMDCRGLLKKFAFIAGCEGFDHSRFGDKGNQIGGSSFTADETRELDLIIQELEMDRITQDNKELRQENYNLREQVGKLEQKLRVLGQ